MECDRVQGQILESLDEATSPEIKREIRAHLADCSRCEAFMAKQKALDAWLGSAFRPGSLSPSFRSVLRKSISRESRHVWLDALPEVLHVAGCGAATLLCARLLPFDASVVFGIGTTATVFAYMLLTLVRDSLDDIERL
jgi:hypothetical protein